MFYFFNEFDVFFLHDYIKLVYFFCWSYLADFRFFKRYIEIIFVEEKKYFGIFLTEHIKQA